MNLICLICREETKREATERLANLMADKVADRLPIRPRMKPNKWPVGNGPRSAAAHVERMV